MLTPSQVAELLGIHIKTVHLWLRSGKLQGVKISYRTWRIPKKALDSFIERNSNIKFAPPKGDTPIGTKQPEVMEQSQNQRQKSVIELQTPDVLSPQAKMKHYIRDIMGEKTPE